MRVLITGAGGFIGKVLTRHLLSGTELLDRGGTAQQIERILLVDTYLPEARDTRVDYLHGDISNGSILQRIADWKPDSIFHLAAILTSAAEREPAHALAVNVSGLAQFVNVLSSKSNPPKFIYPSSIAVFGGELPDVVNDDLVQRPQTTYGTHKAIAELMIGDAARGGNIDGRALRLPIVLVHPGPPTASVSDRIASVVREAVAGREIVIPLRETTCIPVVSVETAAANLIVMHNLDVSRLNSVMVINQPALTISMSEIVASLRAELNSTILNAQFKPDSALEDIVASWPKGFVSHRANALGISADKNFDEILRHYITSRPNV